MDKCRRNAAEKAASRQAGRQTGGKAEWQNWRMIEADGANQLMEDQKERARTHREKDVNREKGNRKLANTVYYAKRYITLQWAEDY